ncbi:hypothetical protein LQ327_21340 [Actinomycetospora endophytica]|uniref:Uncharacterized protein n=1 Tax=Actinomycetospora endophytica TaxID=2291215 RepID=A0ABS8PCF9_9PSEU|nr:hypothetical protein [Actinomycetospora endophytica]MCD2195918.1 hypothetical protein [Actinomycetospora endophytica]
MTISAPVRPSGVDADPHRPPWRARAAEVRDLGRTTRVGRLETDGTWASIVAATFGGTPAAPPPGQYAG